MRLLRRAIHSKSIFRSRVLTLFPAGLCLSMPAIQLARLKIQAARLSDSYSQPDAFVSGLHNLLDFYADRTHRPGQSGKPSPLLTAYHVPQPVMKQILLELSPKVEADSGSGLVLIDSLWDQSYVEFRMLAANLLALIPIQPPEPVLQRVQNWLEAETEDKLIDTLLNTSLTRLRNENPSRFIELVKEWLFSTHLHDQHLGLRAVLPLIQDPTYDNLPLIFRLLTPLARTAPTRIRSYIADDFCALARRAPAETVYFLRQNISMSESPGIPWLARQVLPGLPVGNQDSLRDILRQIEK